MWNAARAAGVIDSLDTNDYSVNWGPQVTLWTNQYWSHNGSTSYAFWSYI